MKKLSEINEGLIGNMWGRAGGTKFRLEDKSNHKITYDGETYVLYHFFDVADDFNERQDDPDFYWEAFAFNKPKSGNLVTEFEVGYDASDFKNDYDIYVLASIMDHTDKENINILIKNDDINSIEDGDIKNVFLTYYQKIFDNNLRSKLSRYNLINLWDRGGDFGYGDLRLTTQYTTELNIVDDSGETNGDGTAFVIFYPMNFDGWSNNFVNDLKKIFKQKGYKILKSYELDPYDTPQNMTGICFYKQN